MDKSANDLKMAVVGLLKKYGIEVSQPWDLREELLYASSDTATKNLVPAWNIRRTLQGCNTVPLLMWRKQRRFLELKQIVENRTIAPLLMARFGCLADGSSLSLASLLYREFDLLEWLSGRSITRLYATSSSNTINVTVRLDDGMVAGVAVSVSLPEGAAIEDRHELIARRGIASDRAIDTQQRQDSVYVWSERGQDRCTDVDYELYGLDEEEVSLVRSAFDALRDVNSHDRLRERHEHLNALVDAAMQSDRRRQRVVLKGERVA